MQKGLIVLLELTAKYHGTNIGRPFEPVSDAVELHLT